MVKCSNDISSTNDCLTSILYSVVMTERRAHNGLGLD